MSKYYLFQFIFKHQDQNYVIIKVFQTPNFGESHYYDFQCY